VKLGRGVVHRTYNVRIIHMNIEVSKNEKKKKKAGLKRKPEIQP
jgi:hypothetical protein